MRVGLRKGCVHRAEGEVPTVLVGRHRVNRAASWGGTLTLHQKPSEHKLPRGRQGTGWSEWCLREIERTSRLPPPPLQ